MQKTIKTYWFFLGEMHSMGYAGGVRGHVATFCPISWIKKLTFWDTYLHRFFQNSDDGVCRKPPDADVFSLAISVNFMLSDEPSDKSMDLIEKSNPNLI